MENKKCFFNLIESSLVIQLEVGCVSVWYGNGTVSF